MVAERTPAAAQVRVELVAQSLPKTAASSVPMFPSVRLVELASRMVVAAPRLNTRVYVVAVEALPDVARKPTSKSPAVYVVAAFAGRAAMEIPATTSVVRMCLVWISMVFVFCRLK